MVIFSIEFFLSFYSKDNVEDKVMNFFHSSRDVSKIKIFYEIYVSQYFMKLGIAAPKCKL